MARWQDPARRVGVFAGMLLVAAVIVLVPWSGREPPPTLADAVDSGDLELAERLIEDGVDPDLPRVFGFTPLMCAVIRDDVVMVGFLLDAGADVDAEAPEGLRLVHLAAQADAETALELLLALGADPDARTVNGMNALDHAAALGSIRVLDVLADAGIDLDARSEAIAQGLGYPRDRGATPLMIAAAAGHGETVERLLELGADINATSTSGHNALLVAVWTDQDPALVELLLGSGADATLVAECDTSCPSYSGNALDWARELGRDDLLPLLAEFVGSRADAHATQIHV